MENLLDWLRLGKLNLTKNLMVMLFEAHELLSSLVRVLAAGEETSMAHEIAACITKINACLATPEKQSGVSPLESLGLADQVRGALTEYEEHRLIDNLVKGRSIFNVHTSFDLTSFDTELSAVTDLLKECGEVICTLPSVGVSLETNIDFEILFGSKISLGELKTAVERDRVTITLLGSGIAAEEPLFG